MPSRRAFLAALTITLAGLPRPVAALARRSRRFTLVSMLPAHATESARGVAFGAGEAARSAALFGWDIAHLAADTDGAAGNAARADAFIIGSDAAPPREGKPVLRTGCTAPPGDGSFVLGACEPDRVAWRGDLERFGARQLNDRFRSAMGAEMTADAWLGWFAVKALTECVLRGGSTAADDIVRQLGALRFDGHKGTPLYFDAERRLVHPWYEGAARK